MRGFLDVSLSLQRIAVAADDDDVLVVWISETASHCWIIIHVYTVML